MSDINAAFRETITLGYGVLSGMGKLGMALFLTASAAWADKVTIAAMGDSLTSGYGLPPEDGFVPQLQAWLEGRGAEVVVLNAGVSGDTTAGGSSRVDWTLTPDVDGMIVALGANDYLRGLGPEIVRANLDTIIVAGQDAGVEVLLVGMEVGSNYGPDYKQEFDAIFPDLAEEHAVALFPDWFVGLRNAVGAQAQFTEFMQPDGLHPNAEGVELIVAAMGPAILDLVVAAAD